MHTHSIETWQHDHTFGQDQARPGERKTLFVVVLTAVTMVVEIAAGVAFGSMALLADGLHMASHAAALSISLVAYIYARRHARDQRYSFGTGKVNSLAGFTGAVLLMMFALLMVWESVHRLIEPVAIQFNYAILVAVVGLVINGASVLILGEHHHHDHEHDHDHEDHGHHHHHDHHHHDHDHHDHDYHHDHNLRSAYLHVLADALTSVLAIAALLAGKYLDAVWLDPAMGLVGAALVARWSWGLLRMTARVLLDRQAPQELRLAIEQSIESRDGDRVSDLHVWSIGPGIYAAEIAVVSDRPRSPEDYKAELPDHLGLAHVTVEVHACSSHAAG